MEGCATDGSPPATCEDTLKENDSIVNFQKFIYELFEKNGILNDLRAYLRGHIIDVLKSSQTGEPPTCQKHFTQRLELTYQALNMLIAEYLLRLEFSYSLSVFVSEIPLANMVFGFAKKLMLTNNGDFGDLKFKDNDVWSILNYLGVKCDSEHASSILEVYNSKENLPLLLCILKCMPMYNIMHKKSAPIDQVISSSDSLSSSLKSDMPDDCKMQAKSASKIGTHEKCKHYVFCKTCQSRMHRLKEKYKMKKKNLIKDIKSCETNPLNVEALMKNIDVMEKSLVDEMFQQLKSVYETEVEMMKQEEEKKIKRSLASHAIQLEKRRDEMEESFKAREEELERNVQEKKKFLWGLARALRDQHANMSRAMHAVKNETERLTAKEDSLKSQLLEAEEILRKRGEDMRKQISSELMILEDHLQSMKRERESIHRERSELENLKAACNSSSAIKMQDLNNEELRSHYDLLKNELTILKKYLESTKLEPRCVIERSTLTELSDVTSKIHLVLNNAHDVERVPLKTDSEERIRTPNKVVNDLKKQKNVNFCTSNVDELYRESARDRDRSRSRSSASSDAGDVTGTGRERDVLAALREENDRLKTFARQQREHIDELSSHQARLQAELTAARFQAAGASRPRTAPTLMPATPFLERLNTSASVNSVGWRKGAGEEISMFSNAQPRILLPGDTLPFVGVLRDRHNDNRRYLINQWRALRRRMSPIGGVGKVRNPVAVPRERVPREPRQDFNPVLSSTTTRTTPLESQPQEETEDMTHMNRTFTFQAYPRERPKTAMVTEHPHQSREKSPKTVLREAKEKLRNQSYTKDNTPTTTREKSPSAVLREAKLRLRKLEIEAEAVEKSYLDFRKRQSEMKQGRSHLPETSVINKDIIGSLDIHRSRSHHRPEDNYRMESIPHFTITHDEIAFKKDFEKYLCEYQTKFNASASHFKNANFVVGKSKPIPEVYSKIEPELKEPPERRDNYLETPLTEFRKLYHSQRSPSPTLPIDIPRRAGSPEKLIEIDKISNKDEGSTRESSESRSKSSRSGKRKKNELEILKDNFSKIYNLQDNAEIEQKIDSSLGKSESPKQQEKNETDLSIREVEQISETHSLNVVESNAQGDLLLVVESTVDTREIEVSQSEIQHEKISTQMTIIVSPKRSVPDGIKECLEKSPRTERSVSPEQAARLTRNDVLDAIFHADASKRQSSVEMELNISKDLIEDSMSDYEKGAEDYPDDFSADVDNYNSRSDYDNRSPISLPKTSEDDNFWDS